MRYETKARAFGLLKGMAAHSPLRRYVFHHYDYQFTPPQLWFLCDCLDQTRDVPGTAVEIGCAFGSTTVFLSKYMSATGMERQYVCLDTFSGFTRGDVEHERRERNKRGSFSAFRVNKKQWFLRTLRQNGVDARVIQADANSFDYAELGPVAFCLLDVDLYLPTKAALERLTDVMAPGGMIVVDDCLEPYLFDGAHQAYLEFCDEWAISPEIVMGSLGIVRT